MYQNRIQKLLFREYSELAEMVLVESPFAETDKDGIGVRQVYLGVTPTQLVIAADQLKSSSEAAMMFPKSSSPDPEVENFELLSVYAIDSVNLSVFKRKRRKTIKAQLCNEQTRYFELGGFEHKTTLWNLWCERLKFLNAEESSPCLSSASSILLPVVKSITCFPYYWRLKNSRNEYKTKAQNSHLNVSIDYGKIACRDNGAMKLSSSGQHALNLRRHEKPIDTKITGVRCCSEMKMNKYIQQ